MTPEQAAALRAEFPAGHVGLLPKITCRNCSRADSRCCSDHNKSKCNKCGNYITDRHMHLDYVGHGAVTDRLLEVDPEWLWEPLAFEPQTGMPVFIYDQKNNPVLFWIRLTVGGVTRLGVGTCPSGQDDAEKVLLGDAIRNAAMRFGVALDLWIKGHAEDDEQRTNGRAVGRGRPGGAAAGKKPIVAAWAKTQLIEAADGDKEAAIAAWTKAGLTDRDEVSEQELAAALAELEALAWSWHRPGPDADPDDSDGRGVGGAADREAADITPAPDSAGQANVDTPPTTAHNGQTRTPEQIGRRSSTVFRDAYDKAPKGKKANAVNRLRHALVYTVTGGRTCTSTDLDAGELSQVWARMDDIQTGRISYEADTVDDKAGVTWRSGSGRETTVMWTDIEPAATAVPAGDGAQSAGGEE